LLIIRMKAVEYRERDREPKFQLQSPSAHSMKYAVIRILVLLEQWKYIIVSYRSLSWHWSCSLPTLGMEYIDCVSVIHSLEWKCFVLDME
jgi:hypothetical protein